MEKSVCTDIIIGRPKDGVCTLINICFASSIVSHWCAERFTIVSVGKVLFVNVYLGLPCSVSAGSNDCMKDILDEIIEICSCIEHEYLVFGEDLNCDLNIVSSRSHLISTKLSQIGLFHCKFSPTILDGTPTIPFTYFQLKAGHYSCIDHFLFKDSAKRTASSNLSVSVIEHFENFLPDHFQSYVKFL